jgi:hypothetical protein
VSVNAGTESSATASAAASPGRTTPPRDYRIAVPEGWERIVLEPEAWEVQIAAIVEKQFKGVDNAPHLKAQLRDELRAQAEKGRVSGGLELYLSLMQVGNVPLPGGFLVSLIPPRDTPPPPLEDLAVALAADGADVRLVDLPAGRALVTRAWEQPDPERQLGNTSPVFHMSVQVAVPNTTAFLLMSFSTPMAQLAEALADLFASIASTLRWVG